PDDPRNCRSGVLWPRLRNLVARLGLQRTAEDMPIAQHRRPLIRRVLDEHSQGAGLQTRQVTDADTRLHRIALGFRIAVKRVAAFDYVAAKPIQSLRRDVRWRQFIERQFVPHVESNPERLEALAILVHEPIVDADDPSKGSR